MEEEEVQRDGEVAGLGVAPTYARVVLRLRESGEREMDRRVVVLSLSLLSMLVVVERWLCRCKLVAEKWW